MKNWKNIFQKSKGSGEGPLRGFVGAAEWMKGNVEDDKVLPLFQKPFRTRVQEGWEHFLKEEGKLRQLMDSKADSQVMMEQLTALLDPIFDKVSAEVGAHGGKYDLVLTLEGDWQRLFPLTYFQKQAPKEVLERWNIFVGRQAQAQDMSEYGINMGGDSVYAKDIRAWIRWTEQEAKVSIYCEKLVPLLKDREGAAYWIAYAMLDYALGELAEMKYIGELEILEAPCEEPALMLEELLPHFMDKLSMGRDELSDPQRYCQLYTAYRMEPDKNAPGLHRDIFVGSSCFVPMLNEFWNGENRMIDAFHTDGIAAGYFCYPLAGFSEENKGEQILDFRENAAAQIESLAGSDGFVYTGGAAGADYGYLDFIAWDFKAVLDAAVSVFEKSGIEWAAFHSFRQGVEGVMLCEKKS